MQSNWSDVRVPCAMCPVFGDWINVTDLINQEFYKTRKQKLKIDLLLIAKEAKVFNVFLKSGTCPPYHIKSIQKSLRAKRPTKRFYYSQGAEELFVTLIKV